MTSDLTSNIRLLNSSPFIMRCNAPARWWSIPVVPNPLCATDRFNVRQHFHGPAFKGSVSRDRDKCLDMRQE